VWVLHEENVTGLYDNIKQSYLINQFHREILFISFERGKKYRQGTIRVNKRPIFHLIFVYVCPAKSFVCVCLTLAFVYVCIVIYFVHVCIVIYFVYACLPLSFVYDYQCLSFVCLSSSFVYVCLALSFVYTSLSDTLQADRVSFKKSQNAVHNLTCKWPFKTLCCHRMLFVCS